MAALEQNAKTILNQKEYLKRYLKTSSNKKERKKRPKTNASLSQNNIRSKIIDDDIDVNNINLDIIDEKSEDETPVVVSVIDERPEHIKQKEIYIPSRWKTLGDNQENDSTNDKSRHDSDSDISGSGPSRTRHDSGSDASPPRKNNRHDSGSDLSPPRSNKKEDSSNASYPKRQNSSHKIQDHKSPNFSPKQNRDLRKGVSSNRSRRSKHNSDSDLSPPRTHGKHSKGMPGKDLTSNTSKKKGNDSDSDLSPPRTYQKQSKDVPRKDLTSDRNKRKQNDSDSDLSPPRTNRKEHNSLKGTVPNKLDKRGRHSLSPFRENRQNHKVQNTTRDLSPNNAQRSRNRSKDQQIYNKNGGNKDLSPPRRDKSFSNRNKTNSKPNEKDFTEDKDSRLTHTLSGLKAGLQNATSLRHENKEAKNLEEELMKKIDDETSGKGAETIFRDRKTGEKRHFKEERRVLRLENQKKAEQDEKYMEWGTGVKQKEQQKNRLEEDLYEMTKPLARYSDDVDLDQHLREKERDGDPMLKYIQKKKELQINPNKVRPTYKGPYPPNRFGIPPGYRWDGHDRGNGFEKKLVDRQSNQIANEELAYKWSVENM